MSISPSVHSWLRTEVRVAFVPGLSITSLLEEVIGQLLAGFQRRGHIVQEKPDRQTDLIITTAPFGQPVGWRDSIFLTARRRFQLKHNPTVCTLVHATVEEFGLLLNRLQAALARARPDPREFTFPELSSQAWRVLVEQGKRGGPLLAMERLLQAQAKCLRILLLVGDDRPQVAYPFDLVGAHPCCPADDLDRFYDDLVLRFLTVLSVQEVANHQLVEPPILAREWRSLTTPAAMVRAATQLDARNFFTEMVRIADLVHVPAVSDAVAKQYSEGCFATWDFRLGALLTTVTGSARPVEKGRITEDDLAVVVGIRPDKRGALYRAVEGKINNLPSSEAMEMFAMDAMFPSQPLDMPEGVIQVPVARSKLHGHRGIAAYHPRYVEYVPIARPYQYYPVSCGTDAQAEGIIEAFRRSQSLQNPADPRPVIFTILPGHGMVAVEKWVPGKDAFQVIWEFMDAGYLQVDSFVPQGPLEYLPDSDGLMRVQTEDPLEWLRRSPSY